jgi:predicted DNA-binding transcriptional regulator AlpA
MSFDPIEYRRGHLGLLTENEVADTIGVKPQTLQVWRSRKQGPPYVKLGKQVYYRYMDLHWWIEDCVHKPSDPIPDADNDNEPHSHLVLDPDAFLGKNDPNSSAAPAMEPEILTSGEAA